MPVDEVADLLAQWRDASGLFDRARATASAVRTIRGLSPDERRTLARALAERGSPDLAQDLEERSGGTVDAAALTGVADRLLALEDDEVERLITDLRDPDEVRRLAREALDDPDAIALPPPGAGPAGDQPSTRDGGGPDRIPLPPGARTSGPAPDADGPPARPPVRTERQGDDDELDAAAYVADDGTVVREAPELGEIELGEVELGGQALDSPDLVDTDLVDTDLVDTDLVDTDLVDTDRVDADDTDLDGAGPDAADLDGAGLDGGDLDGAGPDAADLDDAGPDDRGDGRADAGADGHHPEHDEPDAPGGAAAPGGPEVTGRLHDRVVAATTATSRLAVFRGEDLAGLEGAGALRVLDEVPAGWQRRRAAARLVEAGRLPTDDLAALFDRFEGHGDVVFLAGALLDVDAVTPGDLEGHVDERTLRRLATRTER